jgi:hypothetical protein
MHCVHGLQRCLGEGDFRSQYLPNPTRLYVVRDHSRHCRGRCGQLLRTRSEGNRLTAGISLCPAPPRGGCRFSGTLTVRPRPLASSSDVRQRAAESCDTSSDANFAAYTVGINCGRGHARDCNFRRAGCGATVGLGSHLGTLSLGTRQKLSVLLCLLGDPKLIVLDEAFNGLDPASALVVKRHLRYRIEHCGAAVLMATHALDIVEHYADRAGLLIDGRLQREWQEEEIIESYGKGHANWTSAAKETWWRSPFPCRVPNSGGLCPIRCSGATARSILRRSESRCR